MNGNNPPRGPAVIGAPPSELGTREARVYDPNCLLSLDSVVYQHHPVFYLSISRYLFTRMINLNQTKPNQTLFNMISMKRLSGFIPLLLPIQATQIHTWYNMYYCNLAKYTCHVVSRSDIKHCRCKELSSSRRDTFKMTSGTEFKLQNAVCFVWSNGGKDGYKNFKETRFTKI